MQPAERKWWIARIVHIVHIAHIASKIHSEGHKRPAPGRWARIRRLQHSRVRTPVDRGSRTTSVARPDGVRPKSQLRRRGMGPSPFQTGLRRRSRSQRCHCVLLGEGRRPVRSRRGQARCLVHRREMQPRQRWTWSTVAQPGPKRTRGVKTEGNADEPGCGSWELAERPLVERDELSAQRSPPERRGVFGRVCARPRMRTLAARFVVALTKHSDGLLESPTRSVRRDFRRVLCSKRTSRLHPMTSCLSYTQPSCARRPSQSRT